jgi:hypothetical protein
MDQKPSIGRIVLYQRHGSPNGQHKSEPSPAVITAVRGDIGDEGSVGPGLDGYVDLFVMNPNGVYFDRATKYDPDGAPGTWRWPPRV